MKMITLIHQTSFNNFKGILKDNCLKKPSDLEFYESCQGCKNRRRTCDPTVSLKDKLFYEKYDEVDAVYFRTSITEEHKHDWDVMLIFDSKIVKSSNYVFNSVENYGFMIAENGVIGTSQFSGEVGFSVINQPLENISYFNSFESEIAILESVYLENIVKIYAKKEFKKELFNNTNCNFQSKFCFF